MFAASATAVLAALAFATPAEATDVTRVRLGSSIEDLVVGTDGGAWVQISRDPGTAIGRATPDGRFSTARPGGEPEAGALGPDGQAWFKLGGRVFARSDAAGRQSTVRLPGTRPLLAPVLAAGADATLWSLTSVGDRIAHVAGEGTVTYTPTGIPACGEVSFTASGSPAFVTMQRASDGAMWILDTGCERLVRVAATGTSQFRVGIPVARELAPDTAGGMWFTGDEPGHVDVTGRMRRFSAPSATTTDVTVAQDGSAWFATASCHLIRITPDGVATSAPAPVAARRLGFDPSGALWLASRARLVRIAPGERAGPCDDTGPYLRVNRGTERISLRALRRGVRVVVREPVALSIEQWQYDDEDAESDPGRREQRIVERARGRALRVRLPAARLRRIVRTVERGRRPVVALSVVAADREGNRSSGLFLLGVRR